MTESSGVISENGENGKNLEKMMEKLDSKTGKVLEELQLIRGRLDDVEMKQESLALQKREPTDTVAKNQSDHSSFSFATRSNASLTYTGSFSSTEEPEDSSCSVTPIEKQFVLKHTFKNVLSMEKEKRVFGPEEEHFGVPWSMYIVRNDDFLKFFIDCSYSATSEKWSITTEMNVKVYKKNGGTKCWKCVDVYESETERWGWSKFIEWDRLKDKYLIDGDLIIEAKFKITKMTGIYMTLTEKQFVLKHTFENVSSIKESVYSLKEEHFGVPWSMFIDRGEEYLQFYTVCSYSATSDKPTIATELGVKVCQKNGRTKSWKSVDVYGNDGTGKVSNSWGWPKFIKLDKLENDYLIDGNLTIEAKFKITKMTGIYKEDLRMFDESTKDVSDITLIVNEKKFYVVKMYLAAHSSYFKSMFLGQFNECEKTEITLTGIDSDDFQKFLEVLYGHEAIDDMTVEGIIIIADMYDTLIVIKKCLNFLLNASAKTLKKKLQMAVKYNLDDLKKKCFSEMKTAEDIRSVIPENLMDMDHKLMADLFTKSLSLSK